MKECDILGGKTYCDLLHIFRVESGPQAPGSTPLQTHQNDPTEMRTQTSLVVVGEVTDMNEHANYTFILFGLIQQSVIGEISCTYNSSLFLYNP